MVSAGNWRAAVAASERALSAGIRSRARCSRASGVIIETDAAAVAMTTSHLVDGVLGNIRLAPAHYNRIRKKTELHYASRRIK
jgi:hypothetical protein